MGSATILTPPGSVLTGLDKQVLVMYPIRTTYSGGSDDEHIPILYQCTGSSTYPRGKNL